MAHNVYDNWERLVKKVLHEEKLRRDAFREFSSLSVSSFSSSSSSFRKVEYRKPGITISKGHKNYDLMLNLQLGIRYSIGKLGSEPLREVRASDFDPKLKLRNRFPPKGSNNTPPHKSVEFLWEDYCPIVFRNLRDMFMLDPVDFLVSICGYDLREVSSSPGKTGGFFYLTSDDRFMIKRVKKSEIKILMKILPFYYNHIRMFENTLIEKFYSAHSFKQVGGMKARFVVMDNLFYSKHQIHRRFDLKGSSYGRSCDGEIDETTTLKDLDLRYVFRLHPHLHQTLMKQIDMDCVFLEALSIMDYSLLIGVHFCDENTNSIMGNGDSYENLKLSDGAEMEQQDMDHVLAGREPLICLVANMPARTELMSLRSDFDEHNPGDLSPSHSGRISEVVIYLGISGILQDYDINKKLERAYKSLQVDPISISAVDPKLYSKRFRDFLGRVFLEDESSSVSKGFKPDADSDPILQSFSPSDYQETILRADSPIPGSNNTLSGKRIYSMLRDSPFLIDGGNKSFSLDKRSGKKTYLVGARELLILWGHYHSLYWRWNCWLWNSHHNSRFSQVIILIGIHWLDIRGRIETRMLSQKTNYAVYLVFSFEGNHCGFEHAVNSVIRFIDLESESEAENRVSSTIIHLQQPQARGDFMSHGDQVPKSRVDGWMEVEMGCFYNEQGDESIVEACLISIKRLHWKRGLIVEGIEFRPKCI